MNEQRKKIKYEEEDVKVLAGMILRSMQVSTISSFFLDALISKLEERGIIRREEITEEANRLGASTMKEIQEMIRSLGGDFNFPTQNDSSKH